MSVGAVTPFADALMVGCLIVWTAVAIIGWKRVRDRRPRG